MGTSIVYEYGYGFLIQVWVRLSNKSMGTVIGYEYGYEYRIRVWVRLSDTSMGTSIGYELDTSSGYEYG